MPQIGKITEGQLITRSHAQFGINSPAFTQAARMIRELHKTKGGNFKFVHIAIVLQDALRLASHYPEANRVIIGWAALLHDIGSVMFSDPSPKHAITGAREAYYYLRSIHMPQELLAPIVHCIREHGPDDKPRTIEAKLVRAADSTAFLNGFFDSIFGINATVGVKEGYAWLGAKLASFPIKVSGLPLVRLQTKTIYNAVTLVHSECTPAPTTDPIAFSPRAMIERFIKFVFHICREESISNGGYDPNRGLVQGYQKCRTKHFEAWKALKSEDRASLQELYLAEKFILDTFNRYMQYI